MVISPRVPPRLAALRAAFRPRKAAVRAAAAAALLALLLLFVLGRGPGSLVWLTGEPPRWLPFAGS